MITDQQQQTVSSIVFSLVEKKKMFTAYEVYDILGKPGNYEEFREFIFRLFYNAKMGIDYRRTIVQFKNESGQQVSSYVYHPSHVDAYTYTSHEAEKETPGSPPVAGSEVKFGRFSTSAPPSAATPPTSQKDDGVAHIIDWTPSRAATPPTNQKDDGVARIIDWETVLSKPKTPNSMDSAVNVSTESAASDPLSNKLFEVKKFSGGTYTVTTSTVPAQGKAVANAVNSSPPIDSVAAQPQVFPPSVVESARPDVVCVDGEWRKCVNSPIGSVNETRSRNTVVVDPSKPNGVAVTPTSTKIANFDEAELMYSVDIKGRIVIDSKHISHFASAPQSLVYAIPERKRVTLVSDGDSHRARVIILKLDQSGRLRMPLSVLRDAGITTPTFKIEKDDDATYIVPQK